MKHLFLGALALAVAIAALSFSHADELADEPLVCDADYDTDVDKVDLSIISRSRGQSALPGDPRDSDGNGLISPNDVKVCIPQCTLPNCAVL